MLLLARLLLILNILLYCFSAISSQTPTPNQHTNKIKQIVVVIDVFRAFTTAGYILEQKPKNYFISDNSISLNRVKNKYYNNFLVGKAEKNIDLKYNIPNSPTRLLENNINGKNVFHRSSAGGKGIINAKGADVILVSSFVNAKATVKYIQSLKNVNVKIMPMGTEGLQPSIEDDLCATYISKLLNNKKFNIIKFIPKIKNGSGKYFFTSDQIQYPKEDFDKCLEIDKFNFAIRAEVFDGYAKLTKLDV